MSKLTGKTDQAAFDRWSIVHFMAGGTIAGGTMVLISRSFLVTILVTLALAFLWEVSEIFIEKWKNQEAEKPINRWFGDPLAVLLGSIFAWWVITSMKDI